MDEIKNKVAMANVDSLYTLRKKKPYKMTREEFHTSFSFLSPELREHMHKYYMKDMNDYYNAVMPILKVRMLADLYKCM